MSMGILRGTWAAAALVAATTTAGAWAADGFQTATSVVQGRQWSPPPPVTGPVLPLPEERCEEHEEGLPPLPVGDGRLPQPVNPPASVQYESAGLAPGDLKIFYASQLPTYSTGNPSGFGYPLEPSVAYLRDTALLVANDTAQLSKDSGKTWQRF